MSPTNESTGETIVLARHCSELRFDDLPQAVIARAKVALQECVGIALHVGANTQWGRIMRQFAIDDGYGAQIATVIGAAAMTTPARAALANGTFAQGFEFEDAHIRSPGHPECCIVPAALCMGELVDSSGKDLLTAIVAGCEVMVRAGLASGRDVGEATIARGLFPHPLYGIFGAAASAARVLGLDAERTAMTFGLAGEQAYGTLQSTAEGAWSKRWHTGRVDEAGVSAALLVRHGFMGPKQILEGKFGLYRVLNLDFDPAPLLRPFVEPFEIMSVWFKRYPCWGVIHGVVEALLNLQHDAPFDCKDVEWIEGSLPIFMASDFARNPQPTTVMSAQISMPYCVAATALRGRLTPAEFTEDAIRDPEIIEFARTRVRMLCDDELEARRQGMLNFGGRVVVRLRDGRELRAEVDLPTGHPAKPMSDLELRDKFMSLAGPVLGATAATRLQETIQSIERVASIRDFAKLLRPTEGAPTH